MADFWFSDEGTSPEKTPSENAPSHDPWGWGPDAPPTPQAPPESSLLRRAADPFISLAKGVAVGVPETAVGLLDIPTLGRAGQVIDTGLKKVFGGGLKEAGKWFDESLTPETQAAQKRVAETKGFIPSVVAGLENPSVPLGSIAESIPSMVAGAGIGGAVMKGLGLGVRAATALPIQASRAIAAGAIGEGVVAAGQNTEQLRQLTEEGIISPTQAALMVGSGALTGIFSRMSGGLARRLGVPDVDALLQRVNTGDVKGATNILKALVGSAITEGALEELPQSAQEQMAQNIALGKPAMEGVVEAGAAGLLAGAGMGMMGVGGAKLLDRLKQTPTIERLKQDPINQEINKMIEANPLGKEVHVPSPTMEEQETIVKTLPTAIQETLPLQTAQQPAREALMPETPVPASQEAKEGIPEAKPNIFTRMTDEQLVPYADQGVQGAINEIERRSSQPQEKAPVDMEAHRAGLLEKAAAYDRTKGTTITDVTPAGYGPTESRRDWKSEGDTLGLTFKSTGIDENNKEYGLFEDPQRNNTSFGVQEGQTVKEALEASRASWKATQEPAPLSPSAAEKVANIEAANEGINVNPSEAQKESGIYAKGHPDPKDVQGLSLSVETPKGEIRKANDGSWEQKLTYDYGQVLGTKAKDKEPLDFFRGPNPESSKVFVIAQQNPKTKQFDEHKAMLFFDTAEDAMNGYLDNYDASGPERIKNIIPMSMDQFKQWIKGDVANELKRAPMLDKPGTAAVREKVQELKVTKEVKAAVGKMQSSFKQLGNVVAKFNSLNEDHEIEYYNPDGTVNQKWEKLIDTWGFSEEELNAIKLPKDDPGRKRIVIDGQHIVHEVSDEAGRRLWSDITLFRGHSARTAYHEGGHALHAQGYLRDKFPTDSIEDSEGAARYVEQMLTDGKDQELMEVLRPAPTKTPAGNVEAARPPPVEKKEKGSESLPLFNLKTKKGTINNPAMVLAKLKNDNPLESQKQIEKIAKKADQWREVTRESWKNIFDALRRAPTVGELAATGWAGRAARWWYQDDEKFFKKALGDDTYKFFGVMAATSPQAKAETENIRYGVNAWTDYVNLRKELGREPNREEITELVSKMDIGMENRRGGVIRALVGEQLGKEADTLKTRFYHNALFGIELGAVLDIWHGRGMGQLKFQKEGSKIALGQDFGDSIVYSVLADRMDKAAATLNLLQSASQASQWSLIKALWDRMGNSRDKRKYGGIEALKSVTNRDVALAGNYTTGIANYFKEGHPIIDKLVALGIPREEIAKLKTAVDMLEERGINPQASVYHGAPPAIQKELEKLAIRLEKTRDIIDTLKAQEAFAKRGEPALHVALETTHGPFAGLPWAKRMAMHNEIRKGPLNDMVIKALGVTFGLKVLKVVDGPGLWYNPKTKQAEVNPNYTVMISVPPGKVKVDLADRIKGFGATLGYVTRQAAVGFTHPVAMEELFAAAGGPVMTVDLGRVITKEQGAAVTKAIGDLMPENSAFVVPTDTGMIISMPKFGESYPMDYDSFVGNILKVLDTARINNVKGIRYSEKDVLEGGDYYEDGRIDSEVSGAVSTYTDAIIKAGGSRALGRTDKLLSRIDKIKEKYATRAIKRELYAGRPPVGQAGVGKEGVQEGVDFSLRTKLSKKEAERVAEALAKDPSIGTFEKWKNKTVTLTHWSKQPNLTKTDPKKHGTGAAGEESKKKSAYPGLWIPRTYYGYEKYTAEPGLGRYRYTAEVPGNSVYDAWEDPLKLYPSSEETRKMGYYTNTAQGMIHEQRIFAAGFKGYAYDQSQAAAIFTTETVTKAEPSEESAPQPDYSLQTIAKDKFGGTMDRKSLAYLLPETWQGKSDKKYIDFWKSHDPESFRSYVREGLEERSAADEISANAANTAEDNSGMGEDFWKWLRGEDADYSLRTWASSAISAVTGRPATAAPASTNQRGSWDSPESSMINNLTWSIIDRQIDLRDVVKAIKNFTGTVADFIDASLKEILYSGRVAKRVDDFLNDEITPVYKAMVDAKVSRDDIEIYLHNRHAKEANEYVRSNGGMQDGGSGIMDADSDAYMNALDPALKSKYETIAKMVDKITHENAQTLVKYGLETQETIDKWFAKYKHYVPLFREEIEGNMGSGTGFSIIGSASKGRRGSTRNVVDVLANIMNQRERSITRGEKNIISAAVYALAKMNPNSEFWKIARPDIETKTDIDTGATVRVASDKYKTRPNVVMHRVEENGKIVEKGVEFNYQNPRAKRMAASLKNMDMDQLGAILGQTGRITRFIASMNTQYNPVFGVTNFLRDVGTALFNLTTTDIAGKQKAVMSHSLPALKGIYSAVRAKRDGKPVTDYWGKLFNEFQLLGGQTGYRDLFKNTQSRSDAIERELDALQKGKVVKGGYALKNLVTDYNTAMENAIRLSAYKVGTDSGMSKERAAAMAKGLTVNFNKKGQIANQAGALYAFFNASVQGTARLAETLSGPMGKRIIVGGITFGVIQAAMLAAAGLGDDEPPEWVQERNIVIPLGGKRYATVPMPLGFNVLPNIGRMSAQFAMSGFKDPEKRISRFFGTLLDAANPMGSSGSLLQNVAPTPLDWLAALSENKDWTGKKIYREDFSSLDPTPGFTRGKENADQITKAMAWAFNRITGGTDFIPGAFSPTPDQIGYLLGQVSGGVGREFGKTYRTMETLITGEETPPHGVPLVSRFYGNLEGKMNQANKFYENITLMNKYENEIKGRQRTGGDVGGYIEAHPDAKLWRAANKAENAISQLNKRRRMMVEKDAPKDMIRNMEAIIAARMKSFNEAVARGRR